MEEVEALLALVVTSKFRECAFLPLLRVKVRLLLVGSIFSVAGDVVDDWSDDCAAVVEDRRRMATVFKAGVLLVTVALLRILLRSCSCEFIVP